MATKRAHSVEFYSPGTFFAETTTRPIGSWDVKEAIILSRSIVERYGAKPWGFRFLTHIVGSDVDDGEGGKLAVQPKEVERSVLYFLGGIVQAVADLEAEKDPKLDILISNMRCNHWPRVVRNSNSWRTYQPFIDGARLLNVRTGKVIAEAPPKEPPAP